MRLQEVFKCVKLRAEDLRLQMLPPNHPLQGILIVCAIIPVLHSCCMANDACRVGWPVLFSWTYTKLQRAWIRPSMIGIQNLFWGIFIMMTSPVKIKLRYVKIIKLYEGFLDRDTPSYHPCTDAIFPYKPSSYWGIPMTMEPPSITHKSSLNILTMY